MDHQNPSCWRQSAHRLLRHNIFLVTYSWGSAPSSMRCPPPFPFFVSWKLLFPLEPEESHWIQDASSLCPLRLLDLRMWAELGRSAQREESFVLGMKDDLVLVFSWETAWRHMIPLSVSRVPRLWNAKWFCKAFQCWQLIILFWAQKGLMDVFI